MDNNCELFKHKVIMKTYIGKTGDKYIKLAELKREDYPYTIEYHQEQLFKCCSICNCIKVDKSEILHKDIYIPRGKMIIPEWVMNLKWKSDEWRRNK